MQQYQTLQTYTLVQGDTFLMNLDCYKEDGSVAIVTGYQDIVAEVRKGPAETDELVRRMSIGQGVTPTGDSSLRIEAPGSETVNWGVGHLYIAIRFNDGSFLQTRAKGMVIVELSVIAN